MIIIALGTNAISDIIHISNSNSQKDKIVQDMTNLISKLKTITHAHIIISVVLPRIKDHQKSDTIVRYANDTFRAIASTTENISFWPSYKPFWSGHYINSELFRMTGRNRKGRIYADGVHLNDQGVKKLRQ